MTTLILLGQRRKDGTWFKVSITRSHTRLKPAWREQGSTTWNHRPPGGGPAIEKVLVRRWHGEIGKWRIAVQHKPYMDVVERSAWTSQTHLENSRRFH